MDGRVMDANVGLMRLGERVGKVRPQCRVTHPLWSIKSKQGRDQSSPLHFAMTNNDPALVTSLLDMGICIPRLSLLLMHFYMAARL